MNRHTPFGFYICGLISAAFAAAMVTVMLMLDLSPGDEWITIPVRGGAALLAALAFVATDALWFGRRWAYPAALSLSLAFAAAVALECMMMIGVAAGAMLALMTLVVCSVVLLPIVFYVRDTSQQLFGIPRARPPAPKRVRTLVGPNRPVQPWW